MSQYRYLTTNLITGQVLGDWLPIEAESLSRQINTTGTATVSLDLISTSPQQNAANLAAVQPRKSVLWCLQDNAVVWGGPIWDWNHQSILDGTLPLGCSTMESIFAHRVINTTFTLTNYDIFDMVRYLVNYALTKRVSGAPSNCAQVAGFSVSSGESGIRDTVTFDGTQYQLVSDALTTLTETYEIEMSARPYQDAEGNFKTNLDLAYPYLGLPFPASGLVYNFDGNLTDYGWQATGSTSGNYVWATASDESGTTDATLTGFAVDLADLNAGYPLSEVAETADVVDWTTDAQVQNYAQGFLPQVTDTQLTPLLTMPGDKYPQIKQTILGSAAQLSLTSALHPSPGGGVPGYTGVGRVTGWTLMPGGSQEPESAEIQIGDLLLSP
jgi:hypothetical protein